MTTPGPAGSSVPVVWHVGRAGEVAGGMTQVVNGYLGWPFERCRQQFLKSRDGTLGPRAVGIFLRAVAGVLRLDRSRSVVVVHLSQGGSFIREGLLAVLARMRGLAVVAHLHGSRFDEFAKKRPGLVRFVLSRCDRIVVLSEKASASVSRLIGAERVSLLPNAVPAGQSRPKEPLIVFGGGVTRRKGVDVLLQAWQRLPARGPWRMVIAGPHLEPDLTANPVDGVDFAGALTHAQLMVLLERASIAVLPSRDEAMPMFILEAMARSNCVISTKVGGIPAVLGDGAGMLVEPGDVSELAAALGRLMADAAQRERLALAAQSKFESTFSAAAVYPSMERCWLSALDSRQSRGA